MTSLPKVSIVIACYNDPDVEIAVKSAYNQTYPNKEIILVDDGSNEETKAIIEKVEKYLTHLIVQDNQGQSKARNNGIKRAGGNLILNLDSDDYFDNSFCEKAIKYLEEDEEVRIVTCKAQRFNKEGVIDVFTPVGGNLQNFLFSNAALGSALFRKKDWELVGGYEEVLPILGFEDWEFYIQLLKFGGFAYVIPEVLFNYQIRENSTTARIRNQRNYKFKNIILKHQELYKERFGDTINFFISQMDKLENDKKKIQNRPDHKLGTLLLQPLRILKKKWNK